MTSERQVRHKVRDSEGNREYWRKFGSSMKKFSDYGHEWDDWKVQYDYIIAHA